MAIENDLIGKIFNLPSGKGKDYFRIVMRYPEEKCLFLFPLRVSTTATGGFMVGRWTTASQPILRPFDWFEGMSEEDKNPIELSLPACTNLLVDSLSEEQKGKYEVIVRRLKLAAEPNALLLSLFRHTYNLRLDSIAKKEGASRLTLAREMATYFQVGMDIHKAALLQIFGTRKERAPSASPTTKRGRPRDVVKSGHISPCDPGAGINASVDIVNQIEMFLRSEQLGLSKAELYRRYEESYIYRAVGTLIDGTPIKERDAPQDISYGQFNHHVKKLVGESVREIAKTGRAKYTNNVRALIGTARDGIQYPGQCYIIDATVADVYLVSAVDRKLLIGRPVIYVVIDAFSSLILAVHVTLETANGEQAKVALYRALTPKDKLLDYLGQQARLKALPAGIVMESIFADRGEVFGEAGKELAKALQIELQVAAPYMASWKSLVERYFKVINELVLHWVPGGVRQRMKDRGTRDVRLDGVLTLKKMQCLMTSLAAEWNLTHDMKGHVSCQMLRREIEATPLGFWNYGLTELHASPRYLGRSDAIRQFLPTLDATVDRRGVHVLEGLRFTADWMPDDDRLLDLRGKDGSKLFLDPDAPFCGYFPDTTSGELREVELVDVRNYHDHEVMLEDIRMVEAYTPLQHSDTKQMRETITATERGYRSSLIKEETSATNEAKALDTRSKAEQVKGIRQNRESERALGAPTTMPAKQTANDDGLIKRATGWTSSLDKLFE